MTEEAIFADALRISNAAERNAFLHQACGDDAGLGRRVAELLRAFELAGNFLAVPAVEQVEGQASMPSGQTEVGGMAAPPGSPGPELGFLAPPQRPDSLGRLDHYEVLEVVGHGGMGLVLKAFDEKLHRIVAIKVLAPQLATSATARQRFVREAQAAAAVSHDHVVAIYAVEQDSSVPYLV